MINIEDINNIAKGAGALIMETYSKDFHIEYKADQSPLTEADTKAHKFISNALTKSYPEIPIISEEEKSAHIFEHRKSWNKFWMVDPLDGTKEFIKKNGEFTVNIALIENNSPALGVVYAPDKDILYYGDSKGSFYQKEGEIAIKLPKKPLQTSSYKVVGSRSHSSEDFDNFVKDLKQKHPQIEMVPMGSSLKLCLVADGTANIYPRLGPTMEWDTAAAHAIVKFSGKNVLNYHTGKELTYNKKDLLNDWFIVR